MKSGMCRGRGPEGWFPKQGGDLSTPKSICGLCPVRAECLAYALDRPELSGVWGGTGDRERGRMRKARG
ncbi:MAG: WhiB family transcriptional regulator [Acidimicrobiales bacterium]